MEMMKTKRQRGVPASPGVDFFLTPREVISYCKFKGLHKEVISTFDEAAIGDKPWYLVWEQLTQQGWKIVKQCSGPVAKTPGQPFPPLPESNLTPKLQPSIIRYSSDECSTCVALSEGRASNSYF